MPCLLDVLEQLIPRLELFLAHLDLFTTVTTQACHAAVHQG